MGLVNIEPSSFDDLASFVIENAKKPVPPLHPIGAQKRRWDESSSHSGLEMSSCNDSEIRAGLDDGMPIKLCSSGATSRALKALYTKLKIRHSNTICEIHSDKTGRIEEEIPLSSMLDDIWPAGHVRSDLWCKVCLTFGSIMKTDEHGAHRYRIRTQRKCSRCRRRCLHL